MVRQYVILIFFLFSTWYVSASIPNDDISIIRERVLELWASKDKISGTVQDALTFTQILNSSCYWPDINYYDASIVDWRIAAQVHCSDRRNRLFSLFSGNGSDRFR